ncbi:GNAT family N-acetyltransferase [Oscillochloris sp. ZM17-4]|uniref:GNAT family N-acetyltransferase n=1 Tax=Oscillochloris sp. ZM17-4 TaxID=2866714 RepID=UPI001C73D066|nr:GNAT family N-acetyltransferase [Oscillochloris sp. ZM17-4]MBX0326221.1 GNAT family N-acetyltransferase [Oscillochloris sp. ZM17-4]
MRADLPAFTQIETARLRVRRFAEADLPAFLAYRNDPEVARFQSWDSTSEEQAHDFLSTMYDEEPGRPGGGFQFAVALREGDALIGDVYMRLLDYDDRQGELGYTLARPWHGRGYAAEAVGAVIGYAFATLGMHRMTAIVDQENAPSIRLLERLGMRREGASIQSFFNKGTYRDELQYAILSSEWANRR